MKNLKFIHTADIHLGSLLHLGSNILPTDIEKAIKAATFEGFSRVCQAAIENKVDFVVISGDLFDMEARSIKAMDFFAEKCRLLGDFNISVITISGNHDPLREGENFFEMPENLITLGGDEPETVTLADSNGNPLARVIGQSYKNKWVQSKVHLSYKVQDENMWNIALLHTQLEAGSSNYIPCTVKELKEIPHIHYWALGHIHQFRKLSDKPPFIFYPGIPQGRDFGETERGGCILASLDPFGKNDIVFLPLSPVVYRRVEYFIDKDPDNAPKTIQDLAEELFAIGDGMLKEAKEEEAYPLKGYIVEWIIRGRGEVHNLFKSDGQEALDYLRDSLNQRYKGNAPFLWTDLVSPRTQSLININDIMINKDMVVELDRVISKCLEDEGTKDRLLGELGSIWQGSGDHETEDNLRFFMDRESLKDVLNRARQLILEKLIEEGGEE